MENTTNKKQLLNTKRSAIINIVDATLCVLVAIAFFILIKSGVVIKTFEGAEAIGLALVFAIFLIFAIVCYAPILVHVIFKFIFGARLIKTYKSNGETKTVSKKTFVASIVFRIISAIFFAVEGFFVYMVFDVGSAIACGIIFTVFLTLLCALQIFAIFIERKSKLETI